MTSISKLAPLDLLRSLEAEGKATPRELKLPPGLPEGQFQALCAYLGSMQDSLGFWLGDAVLYAEQNYGHEAHQLLEAAGRSEDALQRYVRVSDRIEPERRRPALSWSHHREVAALPPAQQDDLLAQAEAERWTRRQLEAHVRPKRSLPERQPCPKCGGTGWLSERSTS